EYSPDHSPVVDDRLARLDVLAPAGVDDHGVEKWPAGTADDVSRDARDFLVRHGIQEKLIAFQPLLERKRQVLPLPEAGVLLFQLEIDLIDAKDLGQASRPLSGIAQWRAQCFKHRRRTIRRIGAHAVKQRRLHAAEENENA